MVIALLKTIVYHSLDVITGHRGIRRVIAGELVRFPARWFRYYPSDYEADTIHFLRTQCGPGAVALDIGAHIGLYSVLMARFVGPSGRVFSFEPSPFTRGVLQETVRMNSCTNVEVRGEAVASATGMATFYEGTSMACNANSLIPLPSDQQMIRVNTINVDDFVSQHHLRIQCLKIDVEGAELDVLIGSEQTFSRFRPIASLSLHPASLQRTGKTLSHIWKLLIHYRMSVYHGNCLVDESWFCKQEDLFDVFLVPREAPDCTSVTVTENEPHPAIAIC